MLPSPKADPHNLQFPYQDRGALCGRETYLNASDDGHDFVVESVHKAVGGDDTILWCQGSNRYFSAETLTTSNNLSSFCRVVGGTSLDLGGEVEKSKHGIATALSPS